MKRTPSSANGFLYLDSDATGLEFDLRHAELFSIHDGCENQQIGFRAQKASWLKQSHSPSKAAGWMIRSGLKIEAGHRAYFKKVGWVASR